MKILGLDVINPMTAVAEGASIFAESIDWTSVEHERKASNQVMTAETLGLDFKYEARTTKEKARFMVKAKADTTGYSFELRSADTGWSSGTLELKNGAMLGNPGRPGRQAAVAAEIRPEESGRNRTLFELFNQDSCTDQR